MWPNKNNEFSELGIWNLNCVQQQFRIFGILFLATGATDSVANDWQFLLLNTAHFWCLYMSTHM
jgi:hypothetical protein